MFFRKPKTLRFVAPPACQSVPWTSLKAGDCILQHGKVWYSGIIQDVCASPWSHAAMVVADPKTGVLWVAEMTSPKLVMTPLVQWVGQQSGVYACPVGSTLTAKQNQDLWNWWCAHLNDPYDYLLLAFGQLVPAWWQRLAVKWKLPWRYAIIPAVSIWGVCSTCVAAAYKWAGFAIDEGTTSTVTPADLPRQAFLNPVVQVVV